MTRYTMFVAGLLVGICVRGATPVLAITGDESAALRYLTADHQALVEIKASLPESKLKMDGFVSRTVRECPDVAEHAPSGQLLDDLSEEALDSVSVASEAAFQAASDALARHVEHLRWSSRRLTRLVEDFRKELRATSTLPPFCSELKEWVSSGYSVLPQTTISFLSKQTSSTDREEEILALMASYAGSHAKLLQSVKRLEVKAAIEVVAVGLPAVWAMEEGLGFPALPSPR
jgi:hypothetical protein